MRKQLTVTHCHLQDVAFVVTSIYYYESYDELTAGDRGHSSEDIWKIRVSP